MTRASDFSPETPGTNANRLNGAACASFLAAGIGAFAMGVFVILNEAGVFAAPTLYSPAGGVTGRTAFATVAWLIAWIVLHRRWSGRGIQSSYVFPLTLVLIVVGLLLTFPPVWKLRQRRVPALPQETSIRDFDLTFRQSPLNRSDFVGHGVPHAPKGRHHGDEHHPEQN